MSYIDIVIAIVLLFFAIKGLRKGLIIEIVSLLAFVAGIYGAMKCSDFTAEMLQDVIEIDPQYLNTIAFILTFVIVIVVVNLIGRLLSKTAESLDLGLFDKIGGLLIGGAKGVLLCSLLLVVMSNFQLLSIIKPEAKEKSMLLPFVENTVPYIYKGFDFVKGAVHDLTPDSEAHDETHDTIETTAV